MFSLLNAVQVLPVPCVDFVQQTLGSEEIHVPVLLKAHCDRAGWVTFCGWVPGQTEPVCRHVPTEVVVCLSERAKLKEALEDFCDEIRAGEKVERTAFLVGGEAGAWAAG
jgi:hypothetical protein